eukprot:4639609-Pleurochrysis_carterae.AAC.2
MKAANSKAVEQTKTVKKDRTGNCRSYNKQERAATKKAAEQTKKSKNLQRRGLPTRKLLNDFAIKVINMCMCCRPPAVHLWYVCTSPPVGATGPCGYVAATRV